MGEQELIATLMKTLRKKEIQAAVFKIICILESVGLGVMSALLIKGVF